MAPFFFSMTPVFMPETSQKACPVYSGRLDFFSDSCRIEKHRNTSRGGGMGLDLPDNRRGGVS